MTKRVVYATLCLILLCAVTYAHPHYHHHIHRSLAAKHQFEVETGWPYGRKGYWVDHIRPLACGGLDAPSNMAWQTKSAAMAKDKWEREDCSIWLTTGAPCVVVHKERDEICNAQRWW